MRSRIKQVVIILAAIGVSFVIGDSVGQHAMLKALSPQIAGVQAMLLADKISRQRKLISYLRAECFKESIDELDVDQDRGMRVLADLLRKADDGSRRYIQLREPKLLGEAAHYKPSYPNEVVQPTCQNLGTNE